MKDLMWDEGIRLFPGSLTVYVWWIVCACTDQANGMCYATHVCVWRMQMDLLKRVYTFGPSLKIDDVSQGINGTDCPLWELRSLHWMSLDSWHVRVAWLDRPDAERLLHDSEMTFNEFLHVVARSHPPPTLSPPAPLSLSIELFLSFNTFGLAHFIFLTALLSLGCVFSWKDLIHCCNCRHSWEPLVVNLLKKSKQELFSAFEAWIRFRCTSVNSGTEPY